MVERRLGSLSGLGHPERVQVLLGLGLHPVRQLVQNVGGLVNPAALLPRGAVDLAQGLPEPKITVANGELGADPKAAVPQVDEQLAPRLFALAVAVGEPDQLLATLLVGTNHDQDALALLIEPGVEVDAVDPDVDVALAGEVASLPSLQFALPGLLQPADGRGRQAPGRPVREARRAPR
jgi:hypothetical protein